MQFFEIFLKNSEQKTSHNTFRGCRVHFFRQPFSKQLYMGHGDLPSVPTPPLASPSPPLQGPLESLHPWSVGMKG